MKTNIDDGISDSLHPAWRSSEEGLVFSYGRKMAFCIQFVALPTMLHRRYVAQINDLGDVDLSLVRRFDYVVESRAEW